MTVAVSILVAAVIGGVAFMLIDRWQQSSPASPKPETWTPAQRASTPPPRPEAPTAPLPKRPLWDDPPRRDDDEERPPGLWSGWAR
jgi:hypothetical protein